MLKLTKTNHSQLCKDIFSVNGKALNVVDNNFYMAKTFIDYGEDLGKNEECKKEFKIFVDFLRAKKMKLLFFVFAYDKNIERYVFQYILQSKIHDNDDFQVQGIIDEVAVPFVFFPSIFSDWFLKILQEVPYDQIEEVANGF